MLHSQRTEVRIKYNDDNNNNEMLEPTVALNRLLLALTFFSGIFFLLLHTDPQRLPTEIIKWEWCIFSGCT